MFYSPVIIVTLPLGDGTTTGAFLGLITILIGFLTSVPGLVIYTSVLGAVTLAFE